MQKPVKERRPVPIAPVIFDAMIKGNKSGNYDVDTYNTEAFDHFNTNALVPCECGRTFLPESLAKHQKNCDGVKRTLIKNTGQGSNTMPNKISIKNLTF